MRKYATVFVTTLLLLLSSSVLRAQSANQSAEKLKLSIPTEDNVRITGGPWYLAMELDKKYLLSIDPDRLLVDFKKVAGLKTNAKVGVGIS
jgi:hypothetical protein